MKWLAHIAWISGLMLLSLSSQAQSGNLTQWYRNPLWLNPALAGADHQDVRLSNGFRSQWNPIVQQTTVHFGLDKFQDSWGYGLQFNKYSAGQGSIETNQVLANLSRHLQLSANSFFSMGFHAGFYQRSLDLNSVVFESQYNAETAAISGDHGENLSVGRVVLLDAGAGMHYRAEAPRSRFQAGLSLGHVFKGNVSLLDDGTEYLQRKVTAYSMWDIMLDTALVVRPMAKYDVQGHARQLQAALMLEKRLGQKSIAVGGGIRSTDAFLFLAEVNLGQLSAGFSYDANASLLQPATAGYGALEINIKLLLGKRAASHAPVIQPDRKLGQTNHVYRRTATRAGEESQVNPRLRDSDGDGVPDNTDRCPQVMGDVRNQGCPGKLDSDMDGVSDDVDLCPFISGLPMHNGCPDTDGDGIPDIDDRCPMLYGAYNLQGCPDSDRDGVPDIDDRCPTLYGSLPYQGCPDDRQIVVTEPLVRETPAITRTNIAAAPTSTAVSNALVLDHFYVTFAPQTDELGYEAKKQLRDYIVALGLHPEYRLLVVADEASLSSTNAQLLANRRSQTVREYLLDFGLGEERILSVQPGTVPFNPEPETDLALRKQRVHVLLIQ